MRVFASLLVVLTSFVALQSTAAARGPDPRGKAGARQHLQAARIAEGVAAGEFTARETMRLMTEQAVIAGTKRAMIADDGRLGPAERARLDRMQDRASRDIRRQKHDAQQR